MSEKNKSAEQKSVVPSAAVALHKFTVEKNISFNQLQRQISEPNDPERVRVFTITEQKTDRSKDVVITAGVNVEEYIKAPRFQEFHDRRSWPIGRAVALEVQPTRIIAAFEFDKTFRDPETGEILDARGEIAFQQLERGNVNTVSIGIIPQRVVFRDSMSATQEDKSLFEQFPDADWLISQSELFETSLVPVPDLRSATQIKAHVQKCVGSNCSLEQMTENEDIENAFNAQPPGAHAETLKLLGAIDDYRKKSDGEKLMNEINKRLEQ